MSGTKKRVVTFGAAVVAGSLVLSGCAGFGAGGGGGGEEGTGVLTFTTWASDSEAVAFQALIEQFENENDGVTVELNVVPYSQMFEGIDAKLSSGTAPDLFRVDYGNLGVYSSQG
ncbi:MAG: extracellular solute-binding protein, partial [Pontimonas sp.]